MNRNTNKSFSVSESFQCARAPVVVVISIGKKRADRNERDFSERERIETEPARERWMHSQTEGEKNLGGGGGRKIRKAATKA